MSALEISFAFMCGAIAVAIFLPLLFLPRHKKGEEPFAPIPGDDIYEKVAEHVRGYTGPPGATGPTIRDMRREAAHAPSPVVKARGVRRVKTFTATDLKNVNVRRVVQGRRPLSQAGFRAAASAAPPATDHWDFLTYLIIYNALKPSDTQEACNVSNGLAIMPDEPYNGFGGQSGGAGASSGWDAPAGSPAPANDLSTDHQASNDPSTDQSAPEPSYSAPDPSPSYDSSPAPDYSSPSDSGSSFSSSDPS